MPRILVTPSVLFHAEGPYKEILEGAGLEIVYPPTSEAITDEATLLGLLDGVDGVLASVDPYTRDVMQKSKLRAIARMGVGYDAIDVPAATELGIAVTVTPGTNEHSVAEQMIALLLGVFRRVPQRDREVREGIWNRTPGPRLMGKTLGLVGMGRIGKAVVPRAKGLGLEVIAYDPYPDTAFAESNGVRMCPLDELLRSADIISLHLPCTGETAHMINAKSLATVKRGAVLLNTARGGLVDETALLAALKSGQLSAAGLDVFEEEPYPATGALLALDNVVVAPHVAGLDVDSQLAMSRLAAECLARLYKNDWPEGCVVNEQIRPGWKW